MNEEKLKELIQQKLCVTLHISTKGDVSVALTWNGKEFCSEQDYITFQEPDSDR